MNENDFWQQAEAAMKALNLQDDEEDQKPKQKYDKEYAKAYYKKNKEIISARSRAYYFTHTEVMKKRNYVYMFKKIKCECGSEIIYGSRYRHMKSKIHLKKLENLLKDKDGMPEAII